MKARTSTNVLAHQLANANTTIGELEARTLAYEAEHGRGPQVLEAVAHMWRTLEALAEPAVTRGESEGSAGKPGSKAPSGADPRLSRMFVTFEKRLWDAVKGAESAIEKHGERRDPIKQDTGDDRKPRGDWKVVCYRRGCDRRRKVQDAITIDETGTVVPIHHCGGCGAPFINHPVPGHGQVTAGMA